MNSTTISTPHTPTEAWRANLIQRIQALFPFQIPMYVNEWKNKTDIFKNSTTISTPSHTASEAWRARPTSRHSLAEAARENVLGGAVVSCLKSCQHSARRHAGVK